jgi:hypothetical protein
MNAVSLMHVLVIAPGLLWLAARTGPPPRGVRLALALVAAYALAKHLPRVLKTKQKRA